MSNHLNTLDESVSSSDHFNGVDVNQTDHQNTANHSLNGSNNNNENLTNHQSTDNANASDSLNNINASNNNHVNQVDHHNRPTLHDRIHTFHTPDWQHFHLDIGNLAINGFQYISDGNYIECTYCGFIITNLNNEYNPFHVHNMGNPSCPFLLFNSSSSSSSSISSSNESNRSTLGSPIAPASPQASQNRDRDLVDFIRDWENTISTIENFNIPTLLDDVRDIESRINFMRRIPNYQNRVIPRRYRRVYTPMLPEFTSFESRFNTFSRWPEQNNQSPSKLAEAGFVYQGRDDIVVCYHCGLTAFNWTCDDDPWIEHVNASPLCGFIYVMRGNIYIQERLTLYLQPRPLSQPPHPSEELDRYTCKVCLELEVGTVFSPCDHAVACFTCAVNVSRCPLCRASIERIVRIQFVN